MRAEESGRRVRAATVVAAASLWMALAGNAPLWRELETLGLLQGHGGWLLGATLTGAVAAALFGLLSLLTWRPLLKPAITLLLVTTALGGYFMWTYHVVIDATMGVNVLQTDVREVQGLLSTQLLAVLVLGALVPAWLVWRSPVAHRPWKQQAVRNAGGAALGLLLIVALVLVGFQTLASSMRNHRQLRFLLNPLNSMYALADAEFGSHALAGPPAPFGRDAHLLAAPGARPRLLLLVLGETGRSGNFGVNGYARNTTPELAAAGVVSFRNAWSCGTSTAASVPCMFSGLGREGFLARKHNSENLVDILQHAGLAVLWIDNQAGCKGVCDRVPHVNTSSLQDPRFCAHGECHDEILLADLDRRIAALPADRRARGVVVVMHQMGSHGPAYAQRSPAAYKRFLPECTSSNLPDCDAQALRNAYDNTIVYTDHVLGSAIAWLKARQDYDGALLYVADHGESLGENNLYLHGLPYALAPDVQKHVPWITWLSPAFQRDAGLSMQCLRGHVGDAISHDNLFHTVLGLMQVATSVYQRGLDAYAPCAGRAVAATLP